LSQVSQSLSSLLRVCVISMLIFDALFVSHYTTVPYRVHPQALHPNAYPRFVTPSASHIRCLHIYVSSTYDVFTFMFSAHTMSSHLCLPRIRCLHIYVILMPMFLNSMFYRVSFHTLASLCRCQCARFCSTSVNHLPCNPLTYRWRLFPRQHS